MWSGVIGIPPWQTENLFAEGPRATRERPDSGLVPMVHTSGRSNVHFWPPQSTLPDAKAAVGPVFAGVSRSTLPEKELDQIPDKDEVTSSILVSPTSTVIKSLSPCCRRRTSGRCAVLSIDLCRGRDLRTSSCRPHRSGGTDESE